MKHASAIECMIFSSLKDIVDNYEQKGIPLDVLITDMDWHITFHKEKSEGKKDLTGRRIGGTGFTWNKYLFPDPKMFLDWYIIYMQLLLLFHICIASTIYWSGTNIVLAYRLLAVLLLIL